MKRKPRGFVAICQCGLTVCAMNYEQTERKEAGKILEALITDGCRIIPQFDSSWSVEVKACICQATKAGE